MDRNASRTTSSTIPWRGPSAMESGRTSAVRISSGSPARPGRAAATTPKPAIKARLFNMTRLPCLCSQPQIVFTQHTHEFLAAEALCLQRAHQVGELLRLEEVPGRVGVATRPAAAARVE